MCLNINLLLDPDIHTTLWMLTGPDIPEYRRFFGAISSKIDALGDGCSCPNCIRTNDPDTIRPFCNPCESPITAFDLIRSLPDLDIIAVVDEFSQEAEDCVENGLALHGYEPVDSALDNAIIDAQNFMNRVLSSNASRDKGKLGIDVFFLRTNDYINAFSAVAEGNLEAATVTMRAFHKQWHDYQDSIAEDLFMSRHAPPLSTNNALLADYAQACISAYVHSAGESEHEVLTTWLTFLQSHTNGKNFRIATSSDSMIRGVVDRIQYYQSADMSKIQNVIQQVQALYSL